MNYKQYKSGLEKIKFSKNQVRFNEVTSLSGAKVSVYDNSCDLERNISIQSEAIRAYYKQDDAENSFSSAVKGSKTTAQHKAFWEAHKQFNIIFKDRNGYELSKEALSEKMKIAGGWSQSKGIKLASIEVKSDINSIVKKYVGVSSGIKITPKELLNKYNDIYKLGYDDFKTLKEDIMEREIELLSTQKVGKSISTISKEDMSRLLSNVVNWAYNDYNIQISIDQELRDLIK